MAWTSFMGWSQWRQCARQIKGVAFARAAAALMDRCLGGWARPNFSHKRPRPLKFRRNQGSTGFAPIADRTSLAAHVVIVKGSARPNPAAELRE